MILLSSYVAILEQAKVLLLIPASMILFMIADVSSKLEVTVSNGFYLGWEVMILSFLSLFIKCSGAD